MKKFIGSIKRNSTAVASRSIDYRNNNGSYNQPALPTGDSPEAVVVREVTAFCEAGAPGSAGAGDEYLHLPAIVDAAESSPTASREAAQTLQRYLSKQNFQRGYAQYNAIMLMRILTDNPGHVFTQFFDKSFVANLKVLLRECRDSSVQQITRETLDYFEAEKLNANDTLMPLVEMWRKEKGGSARMYSTSARSHSNAAPNFQQPPRPPRGLPPPDELAARIEESRTSARLLVQMVQSTPPNELPGNELIKEFAERARQAHKSIQQYMACENPAPDEHTMLTLIETSEQLSISMTKHQRALLQARKAAGLATPSPAAQQQPDPFSMGSMQSNLPPAQPPRPQHQDEQYRNHSQYPQYESNDPYGASPTINKPPMSATVSPVEQTQHSFLPPPGPPPGRTEQPRAQDTYQAPYQAPVPVSPDRTTYNAPTNDRNSYGQQPTTASRAYDVSENPFTDEHAEPSNTKLPRHQQHAYQAYNPNSTSDQPPASPSQNRSSTSDPHAIFNRAAGQLRTPEQSPRLGDDRPATAELDATSYPVQPQQRQQQHQQDDTDNVPNMDHSRPGIHGYNSGWQPTPSYIHRQESSEQNVTMHGAGGER